MSRKVDFSKKKILVLKLLQNQHFFHFLKNNQDKLAFDFITFSPPTKPLHPLHNQILFFQFDYRSFGVIGMKTTKTNNKRIGFKCKFKT
jgi:hypothetical protein